jgi:hypothetical protein
MASKNWLIMPPDPENHISKKFAAWLRSRGATIKATGKVPRATRSDKGKKRK